MITLQGTITAKESEAILQDYRDHWVPTLFSHYVSKIDKAPIHVAK